MHIINDPIDFMDFPFDIDAAMESFLSAVLQQKNGSNYIMFIVYDVVNKAILCSAILPGEELTKIMDSSGIENNNLTDDEIKNTTLSYLLRCDWSQFKLSNEVFVLSLFIYHKGLEDQELKSVIMQINPVDFGMSKNIFECPPSGYIN